MEQPVLNEHNKQEYPPMHTAEHLINGEIDRRFGCGRAFSAHIERKKSKLDYRMSAPLTDSDLRSIEDYVNSAIDADVEVTEEYITQSEAMERFDLSRLPKGASDTVRVVHVGVYDECLCARHPREKDIGDRPLPHNQQLLSGLYPADCVQT